MLNIWYWILHKCFKLQNIQPCKALIFTFMSSFSPFFIQWVVLREPAALPCLLPRDLKEQCVLSLENKHPYSLDDSAVQRGGWGQLSIASDQQKTINNKYSPNINTCAFVCHVIYTTCIHLIMHQINFTLQCLLLCDRTFFFSFV